MRSRVKGKVLRSKKSRDIGLRIKKLRAKFSLFMIFIILITSIFVGTSPIEVRAANSSMYVKPVLKDAQGNEYVVDWTNATTDNIMAVAMYDKNKDTSDNLVPVKVVRKDNPNLKYWAYIDISPFDFDEQITNRIGTFKLNGFILADRGLVVYGLPTDVDNNDYREDRYRYLGFDINGQPYSNIDFPNDVSSGLHPKDKHWIYRPWEDDRVISSRNGIDSPSIYYRTQKDQAKQWLSTMVWQDPSTGEVTRAVDDGYTPDELLETFHIQSPPSKYTNGTARGWHDTYVN
ncbi:hypothetical protein SAMN02745135_01680 [Caloranaerobacter azorensis DSM 13643]|uniref:Uncharacterized protein n=1 Tax=Caloranaerobacter azorensis DSM 13643 TaxID=1121264 RepID=A0A1M5V0T2_9FIRM|nr:hypothetical protein [Caloranaerobacter azorensis]SHH68851.1 hypothetical protein SAMN02745135_01680 [Caloranaerobacter azorensis DSM 13643]